MVHVDDTPNVSLVHGIGPHPHPRTVVKKLLFRFGHSDGVDHLSQSHKARRLAVEDEVEPPQRILHVICLVCFHPDVPREMVLAEHRLDAQSRHTQPLVARRVLGGLGHDAHHRLPLEPPATLHRPQARVLGGGQQPLLPHYAHVLVVLVPVPRCVCGALILIAHELFQLLLRHFLLLPPALLDSVDVMPPSGVCLCVRSNDVLEIVLALIFLLVLGVTILRCHVINVAAALLLAAALPGILFVLIVVLLRSVINEHVASLAGTTGLSFAPAPAFAAAPLLLNRRSYILFLLLFFTAVSGRVIPSLIIF
mmetsp:Transcript_16448/g.49277  ORF Transcript_16448/g.49277 Transcript_16448/m.49277 type:complete len:309 (-) Transcript_16448:291-1217(-)